MSGQTALILISSLCLSVSFVDHATGQVIFRENFEDNNISDADPVTWVTRKLETGSYDVSEGDLIFRAGPDFSTPPSLAADPIDYTMSDTYVVAQVAGTNLDNMGIGARWNEAARTGYYAGITSGGLLFVGECHGPNACPVLTSVQTGGLNPNTEDVLLQFGSIGDTLTATAWRSGEVMPEPQISLIDTDYAIGTPAIFSNPHPNGEARYRFINVAESASFLPNGRFGASRPVGDEINLTGSIDGSPAISQNGLELFFKSNHDDPNDLFRVTRSTTSEPFGNREAVAALNTPFEDHGPNLTSDGLTMYFSSSRPKGLGGFDLYQATRPTIDDPFGNVVNLGESLNTSFDDLSPNISSDGLELYFASDRPGSLGDWDIWVARRESKDEPFSEPVNLGSNINTPFLDATPTLSPDGLHLVFTFEEISNAELRVASRPSTDASFGPAISIDQFGFGTNLNSTHPALADPVFSADWPAPGSKLYFTRYASGTEADLWASTWVEIGDANFDGQLTVDDVNLIMRSLGRNNVLRDTNGDRTVTEVDLRIWVEDLKGTYFGDANLDGEFNSSDLTLIFEAGQYDDGVRRNSTWETGDWTGDREFDSSDLIKAFQAGGYERGPRTATAAVPEPVISSLGHCLGIFLVFRFQMRRVSRGRRARY